ncbi:MAG: Nitrogen fixation protein of unknown function [Firmicutes bacterium ADurb.Bin373]|nr:MAG: Nitrogen fixation protein of unknown function [Firmicutes bacterium ADurb.Bin373]
MSKENAKRFQDELNKNESLQKELKDYNSSSFEDLVSFAGEKGYFFTVDEFKEIQIMSDDELAQVSAGNQSYAQDVICPRCRRKTLWACWGEYSCSQCGWKGRDPVRLPGR